jgi:hypothetical protein
MPKVFARLKFIGKFMEKMLSEEMLRRWCRMFSEGRTHVHDDDRRGRPSLVTADLLDQVNEKIGGNIRFTFFPLKEIF